MKRSELEPILWEFQCPFCGVFNETGDDPRYEDSETCNECQEEFKFED